MIGAVTTGNPFSPLSALSSLIWHPAGRLIAPPPAELAELTAATSAAWPVHGTLMARPSGLADAWATGSSAAVNTPTVAAAIRGLGKRIPFNASPIRPLTPPPEPFNHPNSLGDACL